MAVIKGLEKIELGLKYAAAQCLKQKGAVYFGFVQPYARLQHETHKTQAKFLERPYRRMLSTGALKSEVISSYHTTGNMKNALKDAASYVIDEAQVLVPVLTGALRASSFVADDKNVYAEISRARAKASSLRIE